jgi:hypothetical protein
MPTLETKPGCRRGKGRWLEPLACECGIALPAAVVLLMVIALLASVAGIATVSAINHSGRDRSTKQAVAAMDAGLDTAIYRLNKLTPSALLCVVVGATGLNLEPVQSDGWCRAQTESLGDGASYSYRTSAALTINLSGQALLSRKIVVTGTANSVSRRAMATVNSLTGVSVFSGYAVTSLTDLTLPNSASIVGDAATNGNMSLDASSLLCGNALVGPGKSFSTTGPTQQCPGFTHSNASQPLLLNPVDQGNAATVNDNGRIGAQDPFVLQILSTWNPATRVLKLQNSSILTLSGNTYSFCYLEISSLAQLAVAPRLPTQPPLRIYIDSPENCPGVTNAGRMKLLNQATLLNSNASSKTLQIFALGSTQTATSIDFFNNVSLVNGMVYAPRSTLDLRNSTSIIGAVAAQTVAFANSAKVTWDPTADLSLDNLLPLFKRASWVECTSRQTGSAPDSGC